MVAAFEEACMSNPPGSRVKVQTDFGYHIIEVYRSPTHPPTYVLEHCIQNIFPSSIHPPTPNR